MTPTKIRSTISKLKSQGLQPQDVQVDTKSGRTKWVIYQQQVVKIYQMYKQRLIESNALDFDDLILVALMLLQKDKGEVLFFFSLWIASAATAPPARVQSCYNTGTRQCTPAG